MKVEEQAIRDYYGSQDLVGSLKYRVDPSQEIRRVIDTFRGVSRDKYGKVIRQSEFFAMNHEGCDRIQGLLEGMVTKITHLSNYPNEERILRQLRHYLKVLQVVLVGNRKKWEIQDKNVILIELEKLLHESMLRAQSGFEAGLTAKSIQVSEVIDNNPQQKSRGFFNRGNRGEDQW